MPDGRRKPLVSWPCSQTELEKREPSALKAHRLVFTRTAPAVSSIRLMSQEAELDILEYARFHGLARNYLGINPLANLGQVEDCLGPDEDLAEVPPTNKFGGIPPAEKLAFSKDALLLLGSVTKTELREESLSSHEFLFDTHRVRSMKQEVPEIGTDHELDMMDFGRPFMPDLENHYMPMILVDEEADEGLTWPSKYRTLPTEFTKGSESEALAVSSDVLVFLRDTLQLSKEEKVPEFPDDEVLTYKKVRDGFLVCFRQRDD